MRAITIEVNEFSGVAGMIAPGCRVDVVATIQASNNEELSSHTIVQNVSVTAVGQRVTARPDPKDDPQQQQQAFRSVTLLCTPEEAEAIQLANTKAARGSCCVATRTTKRSRPQASRLPDFAAAR
jgi:pilus assembly protein CpaB